MNVFLFFHYGPGSIHFQSMVVNKLFIRPAISWWKRWQPERYKNLLVPINASTLRGLGGDETRFKQCTSVFELTLWWWWWWAAHLGAVANQTSFPMLSPNNLRKRHWQFSSTGSGVGDWPPPMQHHDFTRARTGEQARRLDGRGSSKTALQRRASSELIQHPAPSPSTL